jgi:cytochrome P450
VVLVQAGANRDPRRFPDPNTLDLRREDNRAVAFGFGIHYCLGAPLPRLETQIALPRMLQRLTNARLANGGPGLPAGAADPRTADAAGPLGDWHNARAARLARNL